MLTESGSEASSAPGVEAAVAFRAGHDGKGQQSGRHDAEGHGGHGGPQFRGEQQAAGAGTLLP